jgi:hypothetical protein
MTDRPYTNNLTVAPTTSPASNDNFEQPTMTCPQCGTEMEDFDGFGVLFHVGPGGCGYCSCPTREGDGKGNMVCTVCGKKGD